MLSIAINTPELNSNYVIDILASTFLPSQGLFNALIYMIPLFRQMMKKRQGAQQKNTSSYVQDQKYTLKSLLTKRWRIFWSQTLISKEYNHNNTKSNNTGEVGVEEGECKEEENLANYTTSNNRQLCD